MIWGRESVYCLDTSFLIDLLRGLPACIKKYKDIEPNALFTTSISVFEIMKSKKLTGLEVEQINKLILRLKLLEFGLKDAEEAALIYRKLSLEGKMVNELDLFIGATAKNNGLTIVTADKGFSRIEGLRVEFY